MTLSLDLPAQLKPVYISRTPSASSTQLTGPRSHERTEIFCTSLDNLNSSADMICVLKINCFTYGDGRMTRQIYSRAARVDLGRFECPVTGNLQLEQSMLQIKVDTQFCSVWGSPQMFSPTEVAVLQGKWILSLCLCSQITKSIVIIIIMHISQNGVFIMSLLMHYCFHHFFLFLLNFS